MGALALCSLLIYAATMLIIPRQYATLTNARVEQDATQLAQELDGKTYAQASESVYDFCLESHVTAMLQGGDQTTLFGEEASGEDAEGVASISVTLSLADITGASVLTVMSTGSAVQEITGTFLEMLPLVVLLIVLVSALSAWLCSRVIVRPVLEISSVSKRMAQMDMTWRCKTGRADELGTLATSLNTLAERLTQAMGELEAANARLREDIATSQALERQRRDFFAAASHELKTPVAILHGQIESMMLGIGAYQDHERYLPQALAAVERMEQLVQEILEIAKMEQGLPEAAFAVEEVAPLLLDCVVQAEPLARERDITLDVRQVSEDARALLNGPLFQKAFANILSNAVRYSPQGARVTVALTQGAVTVENTGVTLEEEDVQLLFTPFYRAEKSRSRQSGGSGLGLYIVKTVLDLHGFAYELANNGNAVRFTIWLNQS